MYTTFCLLKFLCIYLFKITETSLVQVVVNTRCKRGGINSVDALYRIIIKNTYVYLMHIWFTVQMAL